jgi:hypothetical protein
MSKWPRPPSCAGAAGHGSQARKAEAELESKVRLIPAEDEIHCQQELANAAQGIGRLPATLRLQVSERHVPA